MKPKRLIVLLLVLLGGIFLIVVFDKPPALPAVMILPPGPLVVKSGRVPDRWIPAKWGWLQRACQFVFGRPKQVGFNVQFNEFSNTLAAIVTQNSLGQPQAESNGVAVWILPESGLYRNNGASNMSRLRMISADRMEANMMTIGILASYGADLFSQLNEGAVDLSTRLIASSAGQTNLVIGVRAQLPYGKLLVVLDVRHPESATNRVECVITADEYDAKGNIVQRKSRGK